MSTKHWIPEMFKKRLSSAAEQDNCISVLQQKIDNALAVFPKVLQTTGDDSEQIRWLNQFISGYCDVYFYYQQNQTLLKSLRKHMEELKETHEQIQSIQSGANDSEHGPEVRIQMGSLFRKIYELLQSVQNDCK